MYIRSIMRGILAGFYIGCMLLGSNLLMAQSPGDLLPIATIQGGPAQCIVAYQDFLFVGNGSTLSVYDASEPVFKINFNYRMRSVITSLAVHKGNLYITANHDGLSKWDISNPRKPGKIGEFLAQNRDEAAHALAFSGDTIFLAFGSKVLMLKSVDVLGKDFEVLGEIAEQPKGSGRIQGIAVKGNLLAIAVGGRSRGIGEGVHIWDIAAQKRLNFHQESFVEAEDLVFGETNDLLHVAGGIGKNGRSLYYILDLKNPIEPVLVLRDTIYSEKTDLRVKEVHNQHDLIFVVTGSGHPKGVCPDAAGYVLVYDATDPEKVGRIAAMKTEPLNLDLSFQEGKMYVASGWKGVQQFKLPDFSQKEECLAPVQNGFGNSAGPAYGGDAFGDMLLIAEGFPGIQTYRLLEDKPFPAKRYKGSGFCSNAKFSADGKYIVAFVSHANGDSIRLLDAQTLAEVGHLGGDFGHEKMHMWKNRFFVVRPENAGYDIINVTNPKVPDHERGVLVNLNDISMDNQGHLIVTSQHSLKIIDVNDGKFEEMLTFRKWGEGFGEATGWDGFYWVYTQKSGLVSYRLLKKGKEYILEELEKVKIPRRNPVQLAVDRFGLYLGYEKEGILMVDKESLEEKGFFRTGSEYMGRSGWGMRELFCWANKLYLVEFYGQMSILQHSEAE